MNTREQITEAIMDYSQGRNGFERAQNWQSEIGKSALRWRTSHNTHAVSLYTHF